MRLESVDVSLLAPQLRTQYRKCNPYPILGPILFLCLLWYSDLESQWLGRTKWLARLSMLVYLRPQRLIAVGNVILGPNENDSDALPTPDHLCDLSLHRMRTRQRYSLGFAVICYMLIAVVYGVSYGVGAVLCCGATLLGLFFGLLQSFTIGALSIPAAIVSSFLELFGMVQAAPRMEHLPIGRCLPALTPDTPNPVQCYRVILINSTNNCKPIFTMSCKSNCTPCPNPNYMPRRHSCH